MLGYKGKSNERDLHWNSRLCGYHEPTSRVLGGAAPEKSRAALRTMLSDPSNTPDWSHGIVPVLREAERILVPFDFSIAALRLLNGTVRMAAEANAEVSVLHVISPGGQSGGNAGICDFDNDRERQTAVRGLLSHLMEQVWPRAGGVEMEVLVGRPADEIVCWAAQRRMGLVVMTAHGERTLKHLCVSATTERVARLSPCPVLVIPQGVLKRGPREAEGAARPKRLLVLTDCSAGAAAAIGHASELAEQHRAELCVLHFAGEQQLPHSWSLFQRRGLVESGQTPSERLRDWLAKHLKFKGALRTIALSGQPSIYILLGHAALLGAHLLIMGPRAYSWTERLRLTSSTDAILRNAPCPVLTVRSEAPGENSEFAVEIGAGHDGR